MVRKIRSPLRKTRLLLSESILSEQIGEALREELGATRRATKTIMRWTGVSDTTARTWLYGRASPGALNLVALAAHSKPVMFVLLNLAGYGNLELGLRLREVETILLRLLAMVREGEFRSG